MKLTAVLTLTCLTVCGTLSSVTARQEYVQRLPNGGNVPNAPAIGHTDNTGRNDAVNAFGRAFDKAGLKWTTTLCQADSDGDGQTNGQELGDPCCEWKVGGTPRYTDGVSHPGDASKKADPALWASFNCSTIATTGTSLAPAQATSPIVLLVGLIAGLVATIAAFGTM